MNTTHEHDPLPDEDVITLAELYAFLRSAFFPALLVGVVLAAGIYWYDGTRPERFEARATTLLANQGTDASRFGVSLVTAPDLEPSAYRAAATTRPVLQHAWASVSDRSPARADLDALREDVRVTVESDRDSSLLHLDVTAGTADDAAARANALAEALVAWDEDRATESLQTVITTLENQIAALDAQMENAGEGAAPLSAGQAELRAQQSEQLAYARTLQESAVGQLRMLEPALPPLQPASPQPARDAALAFVLGVMLTYGVHFVREMLDTRIRDGEDLARSSGLPVLAEFGRYPRGTRRLPREPSSYLRTNVLFSTPQAHPKIVLVTSPSEGEGKSSVAASLAESFARTEHATLLVDADLRKPVQAEVYGLDSSRSAGLGEHLADPERTPQRWRVDLGHDRTLDVVPAGVASDSPTEDLTEHLPAALQAWSKHYDVIVIDSAPVLPVADALTIAPHCTGVLVTASVQETRRDDLAKAVGLMQRVGIRLLGTVATRVPRRRTSRGRADGYGAYGYGYGYGRKTPADAPAPARKRTRAGQRTSAAD